MLLEHKRTPQRLTAFQLLRYMVHIWENTAQDEGQGLPPIIPVVVYQGDSPWPYGQTLQQALQPPAPLAPYLPDFHYELCDLSSLSDAEIRGAVLLRVTLLVMKHIADAKLAERLPDIFGLLRELGEKRTALGYLETLLRYLASATDKITDKDVRNALVDALPKLEETLMPTIAETWLEQGRAEGRNEGRAEGRNEGRTEGRNEGRAEGVQLGEKRILLRQLELRFGALPKVYQQRIAAADSETLLQWSERLLSAQQLPDVFAP